MTKLSELSLFSKLSIFLLIMLTLALSYLLTTIGGCGKEGKFEDQPIITDLSLTNANGTSTFHDPHRDLNVTVHIKDESGNSVARQQIYYMSNGNDFLVLATDTLGRYFPNLHEGHFSTTALAPSRNHNLFLSNTAYAIEPTTVVLVVSLIGSGISYLKLMADPPAILEKTSVSHL